MSSLADEYRRYADECVTWAGHTKTVHAREIFLRMAQDWLRAAAQAERPRVPRVQASAFVLEVYPDTLGS